METEPQDVLVLFAGSRIDVGCTAWSSVAGNIGERRDGLTLRFDYEGSSVRIIGSHQELRDLAVKIGESLTRYD